MWKMLKRYFTEEVHPTVDYGDDNTIHTNQYLDVETDRRGNVVGVWFRCMALPFKQTKVDESRSDQMRSMYQAYRGDVYPKINSINVTHETDERPL